MLGKAAKTQLHRFNKILLNLVKSCKYPPPISARSGSEQSANGNERYQVATS